MHDPSVYEQRLLQAMPDLALTPSFAEEDEPADGYTRLPLSSLRSLGVALEPIADAVRSVLGTGADSGRTYRVTVPAGTHPVSLRSGEGNPGTCPGETGQIAGQAVLRPLVCDPASLFMAITLSGIDGRLGLIQETQRELLAYLEQKDASALRGDLSFLGELLGNFRYNWNNERFKSAGHVKVLDIRQSAGQKIDFSRKRILGELGKKSLLSADRDVKQRLDRLRAELRDYQLALYLYAFSSFLEVLLIGNYQRDYLDGVSRQIEKRSYEYRELYTLCYDRIETGAGATLESRLLLGLSSAARTAGELTGKLPVLRLSPLNGSLLAEGERLSALRRRRTEQALQRLTDRQSSGVRPFLDSLQAVSRLYNEGCDLYFDRDALYLP